MATVTPETIAIPESIASSIQEATENAEEATGNPEQATENRTSLDVLLDLTPPRPTLYHLPVRLVCLLTAPSLTSSTSGFPIPMHPLASRRA
jgi:hypothetical protein